jgi:hypothetical protein
LSRQRLLYRVAVNLQSAHAHLDSRRQKLQLVAFVDVT